MKTKDIDWYDKKLDTIKNRKRKVHLISDVKARKRVKDDLKREQRAAKRAERQHLEKWIKEELKNII